MDGRYRSGQGVGWVELPGAIARKYPSASRKWGWQWVFPATRYYRDRTTNQRRRHHPHESAMQHSMRIAFLRAGVPKPAKCHTLRNHAESRITPSRDREPWESPAMAT